MIVSFTVCHYGSDYLAYALKSVYPCVDKMLIAYSPIPSHGHSSDLVNPDTRDMCYNAAHSFDDPQDKINWIEGTWPNEGAHRNVVYELYPDADLICVIDADEIWHTEEFAKIQTWCLSNPARQFKQRLRTPWRSFDWICDDNMMPDRWYMPKQTGLAYVPIELGVFYHMGYAREPKHVLYKISAHGHKNEWRGDWFNNVFMRWSPTNNIPDLHPTCVNTWNAKPFDKNLLPTILRQHPYWSLSMIE